MMRRKEQLSEAILENEEHARKSLPRRDVSTSRRHQVTTWGSTNAEVNQSSRRDVTTSRRHYVATSSRRDVTTSRRQLKNLHLIIKCERAREFRVLKNVRPGIRNWRTCNTDFKDLLGFLYWFFSYCFDYSWIT